MKLESVYLMNVVLFLPTYRDVYRFIRINKKCFDVMDDLKVNPSFSGSESLASFLKRFSPDTIDGLTSYYSVNDAFRNAKLIKNVNFIVEDNEEEIISMFPKFFSISFGDGDYSIEHRKLAIEHASEFTNLYKVHGDLSQIIAFFKSYTKDGNEMYVNFPQRIIISNFEGEPFDVNEFIVEKIEELLKYIRNNDQTKIIVRFREHPLVHFEHLLKRLRKIDYYHEGFTANCSNIMKEKYIIYDGIMTISDGLGNDGMNEIIDKVYPFAVSCGSDALVMIPPNNIKQWNLPQYVQKLYLSLIMFVSVDEVPIEIPITTNNLTTLSLYKCNNIKVESNDLSQLKELVVSICDNIIIGNESSNNNMLNLEKLVFGNNEHCRVKVNSDKFKEISFYYNVNCEIRGSINKTPFLFMRGSSNCTLSEISFENKKIFIENCSQIKFVNDAEELISPLNYVEIDIEKCNELMKDSIYLPDIPIEVQTNTSMFYMKRFYISNPHIKCIDSKLIKIKEFDENDYISFFSTNFYDDLVNYSTMTIFDNDGKSQVVPATIRYFEIALGGFNIISIGLVDMYGYSFETGHIGWAKGSIGYHSDNGELYQEWGIGKKYSLPYGLNEEEEHIIGCGYDSIKKEMFFTRDGIKLNPIPINWRRISAAFAITDFDWLEINYGQKPFKFDLFAELQKVHSVVDQNERESNDQHEDQGEEEDLLPSDQEQFAEKKNCFIV